MRKRFAGISILWTVKIEGEAEYLFPFSAPEEMCWSASKQATYMTIAYLEQFCCFLEKIEDVVLKVEGRWEVAYNMFAWAGYLKVRFD